MVSDTLVIQGFDYSALPTDVADTARAVADRIKDRLDRKMTAIIEIGRDLLAIKEHLKHGQFLAWLHAEFGWSERTARNYMQTAQHFTDKSAIIAVLQPTEVYRLASPSMPPSVRDAVVSRLEAGEHIERVELREMVRGAQEDARHAKAEAPMSPRQRKTRAQKPDEEERRKQESRIGDEAAERATADLVDFIASQLGTALPDVQQQIEVARSKGADLGTVIHQLQEREIG